MFYLPTYEECVSICKKTDNEIFYETTHYIDGCKISVFNYRISTYKDFFENKAFEIRGLTFVFDEFGQLYKRFLLMEKFFNINENESTLYENLINKPIVSVHEKLDGSIINFVKLPSGRIIAKSKNSFDSEQAKLAQSIYESNKDINDFVRISLNNDVMPIFELLSPFNQIVLRYSENELALLRLRNNKTGEYIPLDNYPFRKSEVFDYSLDELIKLKSQVSDLEGWVVEFDGGQKVKIKTDWYLSLHKIFTETSVREDYLIDLILENKIDDVLSLHQTGSLSRNFIEQVIDKTLSNKRMMSRQVDTLLNNFDGDKKFFAQNFLKHPLFGICMKIIGGGDKEQTITSFIKKQTYRLESAREWLNDYKD